MHNVTALVVVFLPPVAAVTTVPAPAVEPRSRLQLKLQKTREALGR